MPRAATPIACCSSTGLGSALAVGAGSAVTGLHVRFDEANAFARLVRRSVAPVAFPPVRSLHLPHRVRGSKQCGVVHRFGHRCASTCCAAARGSCALAPGRSCAGRRCVRFPIGAATTGGARATGRGPGVRRPRPQGDRRRHRRRLTAGAAEGAGWPRPAGSCRVGEQSGSGQVTGGGRVHVVVRLPATMTRNLLGPWHDEEATGQLRSSATVRGASWRLGTLTPCTAGREIVAQIAQSCGPSRATLARTAVSSSSTSAGASFVNRLKASTVRAGGWVEGSAVAARTLRPSASGRPMRASKRTFRRPGRGRAAPRCRSPASRAPAARRRAGRRRGAGIGPWAVCGGGADARSGTRATGACAGAAGQ